MALNRDLTQGSIPKGLLAFALPLILGNLLQQLYNLADTWVVGQFLGEGALAAVGSSYTLMTFLTSILLGLCMGSSVFFAMQFGRKDPARFRAGIFQSFCLIGGLTVVLTGLVYLALGGILWFLRIPADVWDLTRTYLVWVFAGIPATFLYNYFANLLRAIGNSVTPLLFLGVSVVGNIGLDLLFVIPLQMGVMGAALATVLSQVASAVLTLRCIVGSQGMPWHVRAEKLRLHGDVFTAICTIGVPAAAQSAMYNISNMFIQSSMNSFGTSTIAAWGVYGKIDFLFWMTINSLGIAITTFAGQNFGARQYDRVRRGVRVCLAMAACTTLVISFTFYNLAEVLFRLFSQDDAVVAVGVGMMHVLTPVYITYVCIEVLAGALRGCGDVRVPTLITVFFVCGLRMLWLFVAVPIRHEVATVEMSYPITWSLASALFILYYVKGGWMQRCAEKWEKKQAG